MIDAMEKTMEDNRGGIKRPSLKANPHFNNYSSWKDKLRDNCYKRVREDRARLLWKMRLPVANQKELVKSAFQDIVSDEFKRIKETSLSNSLKSSNSAPKANDELWEYDGLEDAYQGECEEILLEMQRIFYEDLDTEPVRKFLADSENQIETWEDEEDEYLACAIYEHMQLNDDKIWCPICKKGELQQNHQLIHCSLCELQLRRDHEVNLDTLRDRLAEAHADHLDRGCKSKPKFCLETRFGLTALYIVCQGCSTFEVVV